MIGIIALLLAIAPLALARTDLVGCVSTANGPVLTWYVPDTGELCEFLDCGGGRAPPKTTVPGCVLYSGTATYSPSFLPGYGPNGQKPTPSATSTTPTTTTGAVGAAGSSASASVTTIIPAGGSGSASSLSVTGSASITSSRRTGSTSASAGPLAQSTNAAGSVGMPLVGGLILGAAALVL